MGGVIQAAKKEGAANGALFFMDHARQVPAFPRRRRREPGFIAAAGRHLPVLPHYLDGKSGKRLRVVPLFPPGEETAVALRRPQRVL